MRHRRRRTGLQSAPAFCVVADTHGNLAYTTEITSARNEFGGLTWSPPYSADPSWDEYEPTAVTSLSCPSASLCLGTDKLGNIIESTNGGRPQALVRPG